MHYNRKVHLPDELANIVSTCLTVNKCNFALEENIAPVITLWYDAQDELLVRYSLTRAGYQDIYESSSGTWPTP